MRNLSDKEKERVGQLLKEIEKEEPELRKIKTELSCSKGDEDERLSVVSAAPSSALMKYVGEGNSKVLDEIDKSLRQLVPIDRWEECSLRVGGLSTIRDVESEGVQSSQAGRSSISKLTNMSKISEPG